MTSPTAPPGAASSTGGGGGVEVLRRHTVSTRLTEAEHARWAAAAGGARLGRWVRNEIADRLAGRPPAATSDRELVAAVRRVGVNINQIARRLNSGEQADPAMYAALLLADQQLRAIQGAVLAAEPGPPAQAGPGGAGVGRPAGLSVPDQMLGRC